MANEPQPLTPEQRYSLSWEAATQRFMEYSDLDKVLDNSGDGYSGRNSNKGLTKSTSLPNLNEMVDGGLAFAHYCLTGNEFLRLCTGAIPGTRDYDKQHSKDLRLLPPQIDRRDRYAVLLGYSSALAWTWLAMQGRFTLLLGYITPLTST
ncbi:UNVERIFIED_CONTAM: Digalactosyldiacylglycerol synthase 1, chloroplastic [Sesamum radiatum]|uniref:Digalactosyldiacylglycerol synthase 1, chloroplastic n=1 Tax=Sesamum radiatum TaxID=300843 RepID=A0AAW2R3F7_SESRA